MSLISWLGWIVVEYYKVIYLILNFKKSCELVSGYIYKEF